MPFFKPLRYGIETLFAYIFYGLFRAIPLDAASALGGFLMRHIGPGMGVTRTARKNLQKAFPEKTSDDIETIIIGMWDNLGRVIGEYPHLHRISKNVEIVGKEYIGQARDQNKPAIFFAGHLANWEINALAARQMGLDIHLVYRKPNNPGVDSLLRHARNSGAAGHIEKGSDGAREMLALIKSGGAVGMLIDQKMNEGLPIPFFGRDAMTATAMAQMALKYGCVLYPTRVERLSGAHFRMTVFPPMKIVETDNRAEDIRRILVDMNGLLETWVRARPEQWLWTHRRWPEK